MNNEQLVWLFFPPSHSALFFMFSVLGIVFCHNELLMSVVERSVVSENKRVILLLLFVLTQGLIWTNNRMNLPFLLTAQWVIAETARSLLYSRTSCRTNTPQFLVDLSVPLSYRWLHCIVWCRGKGLAWGSRDRKRLTPLVSFEWWIRSGWQTDAENCFNCIIIHG